MQNVTTKKFADMCRVSDANIRALIQRKKLNAVKDETTGGHLLDIEDALNRAYLDNKRAFAQDEPQDFFNNATSNSQLDMDVYERLTQRIEELAIKAGEHKMLTDDLIEKKQAAEDWQKNYFELQNSFNEYRNGCETKLEHYLKENGQYKADNARLFEEVKQLKQENEELKKKKKFKLW